MPEVYNPSIFTPPIAPQAASADRSARVISNKFGDGYEQAVLDGLNAQETSLSLSWPVLTFEQCNEIDKFFSDNKGKSFLWALPGQEQKRWRCDAWKTEYEACAAKVSATLKEVFA